MKWTQGKLRQRVNPYLFGLAAKVEMALKNCAKQSDDDHCKSMMGEHSKVVYTGGDNKVCVCKQGYNISPKTNRCVKPQQPNFTSGQVECEKNFGVGSYVVKINKNATYQCQCRRGYTWNKSKTRCRKVTARDAHSTCRKTFGPGAYAVGYNRDGSYQCQCKSRYIWNSRKTYCRKITRRDGHRACKRQFGTRSYATSYAGNGRWNCYTPPIYRPQPQVRRCPPGTYYVHLEGCIRKRPPVMINPLRCPAGYHRKPGGRCHRN